jgi:hypothetical protein
LVTGCCPDATFVGSDARETSDTGTAAHRINHQHGAQHGRITGFAVDHPHAVHPVRRICDWRHGIMAVEYQHVVDRPNSAPYMRFQKRAAC